MVATPFNLSPEQQDYLRTKEFQALLALKAGESILRDAADILRKELQPNLVLHTTRVAVKITSRTISKIQEDIQKNPSLTVEAAIDRIKDFAGGRFLILYLADVSRAHEIFCCHINSNPEVATLDGKKEDYNTSPKESGYRALHQGILVKLDPEPYLLIEPETYFPFEVQFLTFLQADWAAKEHRVYEYRDKIPDDIRQSLKELSTIFNFVSRYSDELREKIRPLLPPNIPI